MSITRAATNADAQKKDLEYTSVTNALIVPKETFLRQFGGKAEAFLRLFIVPATESNLKFKSPFEYNEVSSHPLIDIGDYVYSTGEYNLAQSIYESPYYWMMRDPKYCDLASQHRGQFLEKEIAHMKFRTRNSC